MRITLTQTLLHSWKWMMLVHHELAITSTEKTLTALPDSDTRLYYKSWQKNMWNDWWGGPDAQSVLETRQRQPASHQWNGVCCNNCLHALNEMSIFQDFKVITWFKLGRIAIAPANMTEIVAPPKTLNIQLATAGAKKAAGRWNAIPPTSIKRLLQTFIALILMGCDKRMVGIWNILKVFHVHVCMGSGTNWPRLNCWPCNLSRLHSIKWASLGTACTQAKILQTS